MPASGAIATSPVQLVTYGVPAAEAVAAEAARLGAGRVFLLASRSLATNTDHVEAVKKALGGKLVGVAHDMPPHSPREAVLALAQAMGDAKADLLVTMGGGSMTDGGKVARIALKHGFQSPEDFEGYYIYPNDDGAITMPEFEGPDIPQVSVPTTLSGGDFYPLGGTTDMKAKLKQGYFHRLNGPVGVIFDPEITLATPEWLWFSTGVRALDHAIETLGSLQSNPFCDGIAQSALELLGEGLPRVKADPKDLEGRLKCQMGVWQSMIPIVGGVPMGASHAIGHALGGTGNVPHGYTSCVMAPAVLAYNESVNAERQERIARALGRPGDRASDVVDAFIRALGMPRSLKEVDIAEADFATIAEATMHDPWIRNNPRPVMHAEEVVEILRMAA